MADFILSVAAVKTAYDTFVTARATTATRQATLTGYGAPPARPTTVVADSDWNNYVTTLDTYNSNIATATTALNVAKGNQRTAELGVIDALGYATGDTPSSICLDQWVHVVGSGGGVLTYSEYIGAATNSTYLIIIEAVPTQAFPNY